MRFIPAGVALLILAGSALAQSVQSKPAWGSFGIDTASADRSVRPGDDFWSYVNGTWARTVEIPADRGALSQVQRLNDLAASQVRAIIEEMQARRSSLSGDEVRVVDYYSALIDQAAVDARGTEPLLADLAALRTVDRSAIAGEMGRAARQWQPTPPVGRMPRYFPSPFSIGFGQDDKNPERYLAGIAQSGLGMPNRDYYLKDDAESLKTQAAYRDHIATLLTLIDGSGSNIADRAAAVYAFERGLAEAHWPLADSRDAEKTYNIWTQAELRARAPGFDWDSYLGAAGLLKRPTILVAETGAVTAM
ncbi:MAG TPA: M13 family metallopeptidase N-terminal domain-containing protein, partial [Sphingomicrobium sp.]|nr:M13 family metallopeptidase N-terminal domain-containing protein [Sphingomicrobium sp.]